MTILELLGIGGLGVLGLGVVIAVILTAMEKEPKTITGSELQKTKEGRELLVGLQEAQPSKTVPLVVTPCRSCDGNGVLMGENHLLYGEFTNMHLCKECGGSGLEGGTDYVVDYCKRCTKEGAVTNNCPLCHGTGVMKIKKENKENG